MDQEPTPARPAAPGHLPAGSTSVTPTAVAKVAAVAASAVRGVHALGTGAPRAFGALREAVAHGAVPGVAAEVGTTQAAVDIVLTAEFGRPLYDLADDVRAAVHDAVEHQTGLQVIEVNVEVADVHVPGLHAEHPAAEQP
ncbi:hypothetical protein NCCP1664_26170 [Zafaria cholistanensis]|uniref:Asp23/Gls24 family envelope stress response protein n=1 Tax=Zafaria cholistanensis TaxID=1682741 RepID=A0A5A7NUX7_9MICC|nr:Asp23/Gls24 family envelope stress response protein [Zafaria cholistanensis]GER24122.1 hypothetical protein NCCP1664_26170 [Zafaria cholistanensis]